MLDTADAALAGWAECYIKMLDGSALGFGDSALNAFTSAGGRKAPGSRVPQGVTWSPEHNLIHRLIHQTFSRHHRLLIWYAYLIPCASRMTRRKAYREAVNGGQRSFDSNLDQVHHLVEGALRGLALKK